MFLILFFSGLFFVGCYAGYLETTKRPREAAEAHNKRLRLRVAGLEEKAELCEHCRGDRVVAAGQVVAVINYEECKRCKGEGFVEVLRQAAGCPCDLCVGDK